MDGVEGSRRELEKWRSSRRERFVDGGRWTVHLVGGAPRLGALVQAGKRVDGGGG